MTEPQNRYVRLPNEIFALGLDAKEIAIYTYLLYCEDHSRHLCYPSYGTIGDTLRMSKNTVRKYVHSLEEKHLIETEETQIVVNDRKRNGNLKYTFLPLSKATDYYMERQLEIARVESAREKAKKRIEAFDKAHPVPTK